jgi:hypothetical protein
MLSPLNNSDYISILKYYDIPITSNMSNDKIKQMAEDILASKLCRCIKKVRKTPTFNKEANAIALCKKTVLDRKNIRNYGFTCKKIKPRFIPKKNTTIKLMKLKKHVATTRKNK